MSLFPQSGCRATLKAMRAYRLVSPAPYQMALEPFDLPETPPAGAVLVAAVTTAVSAGTEVANYRGITTYRTATTGNPYYPGYSFAGTVLVVGEGVTGLQPGDRVAGAAPHASHALISEPMRLVPIPESVGFDQAALSTLGCIVLNAVRLAQIQLGESVAVVGGGLIGQLTGELARLSGGRPVVCLEPLARRRAVALQCGLDAALDPSDPAMAERLAALAPEGFRVVFEATGSPAAVTPALKLAARGGRVVLLGSTRGRVEQFDPYEDIHRKGVLVIGAHMSTTPSAPTIFNPWTEPANRRVILELIARGDLQVDPLISHKVPPTQAGALYAALATSPAGFLGVLFDWTAPLETH